MVDNFDKIEKMFYFTEASETFFHLQVIRRGKDHPDLPSANKVIKTYYVQSKEHLNKIKDEVIQLCEMFKARAYINIAGKDFSLLSKLVNFRLSERIYTGDFKKIYKIFNTCAGELKSKATRWIIDIDNVNDEIPVLQWLDRYFSRFEEINEDYRPYLCTKIPTKNGFHLIIRSAFNLQEFKESFPNIDVHKNNPTILYIPKSLDL